MPKQLPLPHTGDEPQPDDLNGRMINVTGKQKDLLNRAVALDQEDVEIGFSARLWSQVALPYRNPGGDTQEWVRRNGSITLVMNPGWTVPGPDQAPERAWPFGVIPRLLLTWMATEVTQRKERTLDLGTSMNQFLRDLGFTTSGATARRMKSQVERLASSKLTVIDSRHHNRGGSNFAFADEWNLWWSSKETEDQEALFPSSIVLSEKFFDSILKNPVPIDLRALAMLRTNGGGGLPIDIYVWLAARMYRQWMRQDPTFPIPWAYLANQFGSQYKRERDFKRFFLPALRQALIAYPEANVIVTDDGLVLRPSPPAVPVKPLPR